MKVVLLSLVALASARLVVPGLERAEGKHCDDNQFILEAWSEPPLDEQMSSFCTSFIGTSRTTTRTITSNIGRTVVSTAPVTVQVTTTVGAAAPTKTVTVYSNCGIAGYVGATPAYHFDGTGNSSTFAACSGQCKGDTACKSFAFGSGQCLLFNVTMVNNINPVISSPYIFFDRNCPASTAENLKREAPVDIAKRQIIIDLPPGPTVVVNDPDLISSLCTCFITSAPTAVRTFTTTKTLTSDVVRVTSVVKTTQVVTVRGTGAGGTAAVTVTVTTTA